jgi:hypothetical protein
MYQQEKIAAKHIYTGEEISTAVIGFKNSNHTLHAARQLQLCIDGFCNLSWLLAGRKGPEQFGDGADRCPHDRRCTVVVTTTSRRAGAAPDAEESMLLQGDEEEVKKIEGNQGKDAVRY